MKTIKPSKFEFEFVTPASVTLNFSGAKQSYTGAARRCRCGCAGRYGETPASVKRQITRIKSLAAAGAAITVGNGYIEAEKNDRVYTVYFN